jgi:nucleotide-binding universal stress UspA family protein
MERIMAAVDGSDESMRAARIAADLASRLGARLVVVHAIPPLALPPNEPPKVASDIQVALEWDARKTLEQMASALKQPGLALETEVLVGDSAAQRVSDRAETLKADMVVVGSRGRGAATRVLLGSFSDRLVHICRRPVLVVH